MDQKGVTIIESLIVLFLIAFAFAGIYGVYNFTLIVVKDNKARSGALVVGNKQIEMIRNMPYNDVGIQGGIPSGTLLQSQIITKSNINYTVSTYIEYQDDPFDYLATTEEPNTDPLPADYKNVRVEVAWQGPFGSPSIVVNTIVAPKGMETDIGGGTIIIKVFDSNILPVAQADVRVISTSTSIDITAQTNNDGERMLVGMPAANSSYYIIISKPGYSSDFTCTQAATGTECVSGIPEPARTHLSVIEGDVTEAAFYIDRVSTFNIRTINMNVSNIFQVNTDGSGADQTRPAIDIDAAGNLYYAWVDDRDSPGNVERVYAQKYSSTTEAQWTPDDIAVTSSNNQALPTVKTDSAGNTYFAWGDDKNGNQDIYLDKFNADGIAQWSGAKKVSVGNQNDDQGYPALVLDSAETNIFMAFWDNGNDNGDIYIQKFDTNGDAAWASEILVNDDAGSNMQSEPAIARDSADNIYVVWEDSRDGDNNIYMQKFDPVTGSALWANNKRANLATAADQSSPDIYIDASDNIYVVWEDLRNDDYDIYISKLDTDGDFRWSNDERVNTDTTTHDQTQPVLAIGGMDSIYVAWTDERNGNKDIYMQRMDATGQNQWQFDIRMNQDTNSTVQDNPDIIIDIDTYPIVVWNDDNSGDNDIISAKYTSPDMVNMGNVPITLSGSKLVGNNPQILKYSHDFTSDSNGFLTINNLEFDGYNISVGGGYALKSLEPTAPITLLANTTTDVWVNVE